MLIIVPARKGSKGIPGKNRKPFRGAALIEWSFAAADYLSQKLDAQILCTTDDPAIADLVQANHHSRIAVHNRPPALASDSAGMADVVCDACAQSDAARYILLQPTSPLRLTDDLDRFCDAMQRNDTVVSCTLPSEHPKDLITLDKTRGQPAFETPKTLTRQDSATNFRFVDGAFYAGQVQALRQTGSFLPQDSCYVTLSNPAAVDIDTPYDWAMAEAQHDYLLARGQNFVRPSR